MTEGNSRGQMREDFYKRLIVIYNNTDFFDSEEQIAKFRLFLEKIEEGTLESPIRITALFIRFTHNLAMS